jgi:hypothetical protein
VASQAWCRPAAAMLVCPAVFEMPMARLRKGGHGLGSAAGADLGGVFAVADIERTWCSASICQWPRIQLQVLRQAWALARQQRAVTGRQT